MENMLRKSYSRCFSPSIFSKSFCRCEKIDNRWDINDKDETLKSVCSTINPYKSP